MHVTAAPILDHMAALADPIRCRMLLPLERHELTVNEICSVLQLPQSTVSRHLKTLADDGWVSSRRDGTSRFYGMVMSDLDPGAQRLWPLIREQIAGTNGAEQDERRLKSVLAQAAIEVRRVLRVGVGAVGSPARRSCSAIASICTRMLALTRSDADSRRSGMRHGAGERARRAACRQGDRRRRLDRHGPGGAEAPQGPASG